MLGIVLSRYVLPGDLLRVLKKRGFLILEVRSVNGEKCQPLCETLCAAQPRMLPGGSEGRGIEVGPV